MLQTEIEAVDGEDLVGMRKKELTLYRRNKVGFVFQFYNLMPNLTALENVELASEICKDAYDPMEILEKVGLEERASAFPTTLSVVNNKEYLLPEQ